jgi:hypothetical protein
LIVGIKRLNPDEVMDIVCFVDSAPWEKRITRSEEYYRVCLSVYDL